MKDYFNIDHLKDDIKKHALRGGTISIIGQISSFGIQTIGTIILARLLTPGDFGLVTMVLTIGLLLGNFGVNGITEAVIQAKEINHKQASTLFWINNCVNVVIAILFVSSSFIIVWFYKEPLVKQVVLAIAAANVISSLSVVHLAILMRNIEFHKISFNNIVAVIISSAVPILLALLGWGYWALVSKWLVLPIMITTGAWILCGWRPSLPAKNTNVVSMLRFSFHTYGNYVVGYFRKNIDKILIGRLFGSQPLGYYDRAFQLSGLLPNQIIYPLFSVAISSFSKLANDPERYRSNFLKLLSMIAFVCMPLSAILSLISHDVIIFLFGEKWNKAGEIFLAFGLSVGVVTIYLSTGWLHLSLATPDRYFRWSFVEFIVTTLCIVIGLSYGAFGVAIGYSISYYILIGPAFWYAGKPVNLKFSLVFSRLWRFYLSALAAAACCWFVFYYYNPTLKIYHDLNILARIGTSISLCVFLYLMFILIMHNSFRPIREFIIFLREIMKLKTVMNI